MLTLFLRKNWEVVGILGLALFLIARNKDRDSLETFLLYFLSIVLINGIIKIWSYAHSRYNRMQLLERYYEIYNDKIIERYSGSYNLIKIEHFVKADQLRKFSLLYTSKDNFIIIPNESFKNELDRDWFERDILSKIQE